MKQGLILWVLVFLGPAAWFVDLEANLAFSTQECAGPWTSAPAVVTIAAFLASGMSALLLWTRFRAMRQTQPPTLQVYKIVAVAGMLLSIAFAIVIIAESIPVWMLRNCQ